MYLYSPYTLSWPIQEQLHAVPFFYQSVRWAWYCRTCWCLRVELIYMDGLPAVHTTLQLWWSESAILDCTSAKRASLATINPLKPELNPICYLLALLGAQHFLHVSRIRVKLLTFRLLMSYIYIYIYMYIYVYGVPILDVSRSHTTTQHSR